METVGAFEAKTHLAELLDRRLSRYSQVLL